MTDAVHHHTTEVLHWRPFVTPVRFEELTARQREALKITPANRKVSDYVLTLSHDPESLHRSPLFNGIMYGKDGLAAAANWVLSAPPSSTAASTASPCMPGISTRQQRVRTSSARFSNMGCRQSFPSGSRPSLIFQSSSPPFRQLRPPRTWLVSRRPGSARWKSSI